MEEQPCSVKEKIFFWLRFAAFLLLTGAVLQYGAYVLTPKNDYGICSMQNLYFQEPDSVDVLVVGTSLAYAGVNTNVLWQDYGIAAYDLCSAEQPFWVSFYYLQEALKFQKPELIILDAKPAIYDRDYSREGRTILSTSGIRSPFARIQAICACVEEEDVRDFALVYPKLHGRYDELSLSDFRYPADNGGRGKLWKGYIEQDETEHVQRPSLVWVNTKRNINDRQEEYARRIFELANEREIPIVLMGFPCPDYANDHMYFNTLAAVAEEYNVPFVNYNHPDLRFGLRYSTDFADWQHLNIKGSVIFSKKLGMDLQQDFGIPDRRGDPKYDSYSQCAQKWYSDHPEYVQEVGA